MKKILFFVLLLFLVPNTVYSEDLFADDNNLSFYRQFGACNKTYLDYDEVLKDFPDNYYFATVKITKSKYPILFVTDKVYDYDQNTKAANYAIIYSFKKYNKKVSLVGFQSGSNYPLSASKRFFYQRGNDRAGRYYINSKGTLIIERDIQRTIKDDNEINYYFSNSGIIQGKVKNSKRLNRLFRQYNKTSPINFKQIKDKN